MHTLTIIHDRLKEKEFPLNHFNELEISIEKETIGAFKDKYTISFESNEPLQIAFEIGRLVETFLHN